MQFTRQFKALVRVAVLFSGAWAAIGGIVAGLRWVFDRDGSVLAQVATHAVMYGAVGAISGMATALILARAEAGRQAQQLSTRRVATWGMVGGVAPTALFGLLALVFGAPADSYLPLMGVGIISGGIGAAVAASASVAAKRASLNAVAAQPRLPAT